MYLCEDPQGCARHDKALVAASGFGLRVMGRAPIWPYRLLGAKG